MSAFQSLKSFFAPKDPTIALPGDVFVVIDREKTIQKLKLDERAEANGIADIPPSDSEGFDDVEAEIVAEMSEQAKRAHTDAQNNYRVYGRRLSELALLRELSSITGASSEAISDFQAIVRKWKGRLSLARDAIAESYQELADFKAEHGLARTAHKGMLPIYAWSTILFSWVVESIANTAFLRVNDDLGIVGGFVAALVIAAINIGLSALVGRFWWPYLFHKSAKRKWLSAGGCTLWFIGLILWNLLAAHYRDAKAGGMDAPEIQALGLLRDNWFDLTSIYSYGLLGAGIAFGLLAALAAFKMDDPYPGYGEIYRRHERRCEEYADQIEDALDELKERRDEANGEAAEIRTQLGAQFRERGLIISNREGLRSSYASHQSYLEQMGNTLLDSYRTANRRARSSPAPGHFNERWKIERSDLPVPDPEPSLDEEVQRTQNSLDRSIKEVTQGYDKAITQFEHLDEIKRSLQHG